MKDKSSEPNTPAVKTPKPSQQKSDKKGVKRRRDADQRILDQFWHIGDPKPAKRFKSLQLIVDILIKQNVFINCVLT